MRGGQGARWGQDVADDNKADQVRTRCSRWGQGWSGENKKGYLRTRWGRWGQGWSDEDKVGQVRTGWITGSGNAKVWQWSEKNKRQGGRKSGPSGDSLKDHAQNRDGTLGKDSNVNLVNVIYDYLMGLHLEIRQLAGVFDAGGLGRQRFHWVHGIPSSHGEHAQERSF
jgi:hypothetical protein